MEKQTILDYDNLAVGHSNQIRGFRNIILGERNKLEGMKNWVFTANYQGRIKHTLILDRWKIDL